MKILFLLTQDLSSPGGLGRYFPLAKELAKIGNTVHIVALHPDFKDCQNKRLVEANVEIEYVAPMHVKKMGNIKSYYSNSQLILLSIYATLKLIQSAWKIPADIVHIGKPHPMNGIAGIFKGFGKCQVYVDCDDDEVASGVFNNQFQRKIVAWFEKKIPLNVDFITTNTNYTRNRLISNGIEPSKIIYLSSGVDMDRFRPPDFLTIQKIKNELGLTNEPVISYIGSISLSSHPINLLLEAFRLLLQKKPDVKMLIVGGGDDFNTIQIEAKKLGVENSIKFIGKVPAHEVVNYYYISNLIVDPMFDNNAAKGRQPLKLFECWACGVPYVSANVGVRSDVLGNPPAGLLTIPGDARSLSESINHVLSNPELAEEIRSLGFKRVQNYTWDKIANKLNLEYSKRLKNGL